MTTRKSIIWKQQGIQVTNDMSYWDISFEEQDYYALRLNVENPEEFYSFLEEDKVLDKVCPSDVDDRILSFVKAIPDSANGCIAFLHEKKEGCVSLAQQIANKKAPQSIKGILNIVKNIAQTVKKMIESNHFHGWLDPTDIILTSNNELQCIGGWGELLILDAYARYLQIHHNKNARDGLNFTEFMAPEVQRGERCDAKSDIYSLGKIFEKLLVRVTPNPPSEYRRFIDKCTNEISSKRLSIDDFLNEIRGFINKIQPLTVPPPPPPVKETSSLEKWVETLLFAVIIGIILVLWSLDAEQRNALDNQYSETLQRMSECDLNQAGLEELTQRVKSWTPYSKENRAKREQLLKKLQDKKPVEVFGPDGNSSPKTEPSDTKKKTTSATLDKIPKTLTPEELEKQKKELKEQIEKLKSACQRKDESNWGELKKNLNLQLDVEDSSFKLEACKVLKEAIENAINEAKTASKSDNRHILEFISQLCQCVPKKPLEYKEPYKFGKIYDNWYKKGQLQIQLTILAHCSYKNGGYISEIKCRKEDGTEFPVTFSNEIFKKTNTDLQVKSENPIILKPGKKLVTEFTCKLNDGYWTDTETNSIVTLYPAIRSDVTDTHKVVFSNGEKITLTFQYKIVTIQSESLEKLFDSYWNDFPKIHRMTPAKVKK